MNVKDREQGVEASRQAALAPLYQRLPHGPHRLGTEEVIRNQRTRMHGAMIEAVARNGYEGTSVKQVVGLAGVSRRSFYEQFANKQECFLATYRPDRHARARRVAAAYRSARGDAEERMQAAFGELGQAISANWNSASLAILEAPKAGAPALLRLRRASATFEQMLAGCFEHSSTTSPLPAPVDTRNRRRPACGIVGLPARGNGADGAGRHRGDVSLDVAFQTPGAEQLAERLSERARTGARAGAQGADAGASGNGRRGDPAASASDCSSRRCDWPWPRTIASSAHRRSPTRRMCRSTRSSSSSTGKQECFLAALDMLDEELMTLSGDPDCVRDWPSAVRHTIGELMRYLAEHPVYAQTIAQGAFAAGPEANERNVRLAHGIAARLTAGAPGRARSKLVVQGVAGALSHTVRCQVASGQIQLLSVLSDYLSYIVLDTVHRRRAGGARGHRAGLAPANSAADVSGALRCRRSAK